jgi:ankyrin repeat protein
MAARVGDSTVIEILLASGADRSAIDDYQQTALHCAAEEGSHRCNIYSVKMGIRYSC